MSDSLRPSVYEGEEVISISPAGMKHRRLYRVYDRDGYYMSGELVRRKGGLVEIRFGEFSVQIVESAIDEIVPVDDLDQDESLGTLRQAGKPVGKGFGRIRSG